MRLLTNNLNGTAPNPQKALLVLQQQIYEETVRAERPLPHLMTWLLDRRNLEAAWDRVRSADGASTPGEDRLTCNSIQPRLADWLSRLSEDLYHGRYQPGSPLWVDVPKSRPGQFRRLGILTIRDRVVHAAIKQVLEPVLEPFFLPCSYGFRPGRSVAGALAEAVRLLDASANNGAPLTAGASLDVATCFDTVDHQCMLAELANHTADAEMLRLVGMLLAAGGGTVRRLWRTRRVGLVQGGALSPLLCNLYLHSLDRRLTTLGQDLGDRLHALRYADNILLLAGDARTGKQGVQAVRRHLAGLHQQLGERRPRLSPVGGGIDWLGVRLGPRPFPLEDRSTFGYVIPEAKVHAMLARVMEITTPPSDKIDAGVFNLEKWIVAINRQLRDWRGAYLFADNSAEVFRTLDDYARLRFGRLLGRITGQRAARVRRLYRVKLPRGFWTWMVNGVRMSVLSSLAPHCPAQLTFPPAWMRRGAAHPPGPSPVDDDVEPTPTLGDVAPLPHLPQTEQREGVEEDVGSES